MRIVKFIIVAVFAALTPLALFYQSLYLSKAKNSRLATEVQAVRDSGFYAIELVKAPVHDSIVTEKNRLLEAEIQRLSRPTPAPPTGITAAQLIRIIEVIKTDSPGGRQYSPDDDLRWKDFRLEIQNLRDTILFYWTANKKAEFNRTLLFLKMHDLDKMLLDIRQDIPPRTRRRRDIYNDLDRQLLKMDSMIFDMKNMLK